MNNEPFKVRDWWISGVFSGYRVCRGAGWDIEVAKGFPYDCAGDYSIHELLEDAERFCEELNKKESLSE